MKEWHAAPLYRKAAEQQRIGNLKNEAKRHRNRYYREHYRRWVEHNSRRRPAWIHAPGYWEPPTNIKFLATSKHPPIDFIIQVLSFIYLWGKLKRRLEVPQGGWWTFWVNRHRLNSMYKNKTGHTLKRDALRRTMKEAWKQLGIAEERLK